VHNRISYFLLFIAVFLSACHKVEPEPLCNDGDVVVLQTATEGNGIDLILMADGYTASQVNDGTYEKVMRDAMETFLSEHPISGFRHLFNVYYVVAVSQNAGCMISGNSTVFSTSNPSGSRINANTNLVRRYATRAVGEERIKKAVVVVMLNTTLTAGTTWYLEVCEGDYGAGLAVAYTPYNRGNRDFRKILLHEAGGHALGKLADEYCYQKNGALTQDAYNEIMKYAPCGYYRNIDVTSDKSKVKWSKFIGDERYADENISVYMGGFTYYTGVYRSTGDSLMGHVTDGAVFNAPSREALYVTMNKLAYGPEWQYDYDTFVEFDLANR